VAGLSPGTGSVFELLPPQNATGNWIKVVQRVPVRITLKPQEIKEHPLRLGLSLTVQINVHDTSGPTLPGTPPTGAVYSTGVYQHDRARVEQLINRIIKDNTVKQVKQERNTIDGG
jgi:membrane fusion protein (multidrug efflux system)